MTENKYTLFSLKEEPAININLDKIKNRNSVNSKKIFGKRFARHSMDIKNYFNRKPFSTINNSSSPVDLCLNALDIMPNKRTNEYLQHIISYLKSLPNFMNIISSEKNSKLSENLIEQISIHLRHEFIPKNNLVCRFGEKGEKFYIILKGKVNFLIPKPSKCYLNLEEYILYLMQLRKNKEYELIDNLLVENRISFHIEEDDLDHYLIKEYEEYQKYLKKTGRNYNRSKTKIPSIRFFNNRLSNERRMDFMPTLRTKNNFDITDNLNDDKKDKKCRNQKHFFSINTYHIMEEVIEIIKNPKLVSHENPFLGVNSPINYMKINNVVDTKLESKGRKLVNIFIYEEMCSFDNGQTFGFIALQSKNSKRAATAIVVEDSDLGVLTKEEYLQFFEILSSKEKKKLYELLKFYNLITTISEYKFIKKYYHMFEYINFHKNNIIMDTTKPINNLLIFNSGLFVVNISVNISELNDLITKIKMIRGKLMGLSNNKIEKELEEKRENQDIIIKKNYISLEDNKALLKKYNYTLSMISDHFLVGYPDTVDPVTHLPLFNCSCLSVDSDGYLISNKSIDLVNQESIVIQNLVDYCLLKIEYNLNRLYQFKNEIISKSRNYEISSPLIENLSVGKVTTPTSNSNEGIYSEYNTKKELNINNNEENNNYVERNQTIKKRSKNNSKNLILSRINSSIVDTINNYKFSTKNEEIKNNREKDKKKLLFSQGCSNLRTRNKSNINNKNIGFGQSKTYIIRKLRESILEKQKKIELKKERYYKALEDISESKKEKMKKKLENNSSMNVNPVNDIDSILNNINKDINNDRFTNRLQSSSSKDCHSSSSINLISKSKRNKNKNKRVINNINSVSYKAFNNFRNKENLLTLPPIEKNKSVDKINITESESKSKIQEMGKNQNNKKKKIYISHDDLYKLTNLSPSIVKNKYIVFKSPHKKMREDFYTEGNEYKLKSLRPVRLKKENFKNLQKFNNIANDNDDEEIKNDYISIVTPNNQLIRKNMIENSIKEKYKELNNLVRSLHKTTNEILDKNN